MNEQAYTTVFKVTDKNMLDFMMFIPVYFLVFFIIIYFVNRNRKESQKGIIFILIMIVVTTLASIITISSVLKERLKTKRIFFEKTFNVVEGEIENFNPMPVEGHKYESFTVNGLFFEYSDFSPTYSFNQSASHGGPIHTNGQKVRISYISNKTNNYILKIEVKKNTL
jgi:hypothetical protein